MSEIESDLHNIKEETLLKSIWLRPTDTLNYILENCPEKYVTVLLVLGGINSAIERAVSRSSGDTLNLGAVLAIAIIAGGLFGWISYYIYAWAMSETGRWLDGSAEPKEFRTVIAWSLVPMVVSLSLIVPELMIFGGDLFKSEIPDNSLGIAMSYIFFGLIEIILGIWSLVIMVKGIAIIQKFGIGYAILNMIIPILILIVPLLLIIALVS